MYLIGRLILMLLVSWCFLFPSGECNAMEKGDNPPDIYGYTLDNEYFKLSSLPAPMVISFFSVTCIPCRYELPELAELESRYPSISFVAVHVDYTDISMNDIKAFINSLKGSPARIISSGSIVMDDYDIKALPYTVVLDKEGYIQSTQQGYKKNETIEELERILSEF